MSALILLAALLALPMPALTAARAEVDRAEHQAADLAAERAAVQKDLDRLAGEIAARKASLPRGAGPDQDLLAMLQRSTLLVQQIESLQRRFSAAQAGARAAQQRLSEECARGAKDLEQWSLSGRSEAEARGGLQDSLAQLAKDCSGGPVAKEDSAHAGVPVTTLEAAPSDDAQRLRQKADFLRDREDRLRRQVVLIDQRIQAMKRDRALQHRMAEFLQENSLFDEDDRRVARAEVPVAAGAGAAASNPAPKADSAAAPVSTFTAAPASVQTATAASAPGSTTGPTKTALSDVPAIPSPTVARSAVLQGPEGSVAAGALGGPDESLESLSARRAILAAEADRLHIAAMALEAASGEPR